MQRGAGGTSGGLLEFFIGAGMIAIGGWFFFQNLVVTSSFRVLWGADGSGLGLIVLLAGIGVLFFSGRSMVGWVMIAIGAAVIILNVLSNLVIYFAPTSLMNTILMLGLIFGGLGLVARAVRPH
ncbi:MAG: hypothetical protein SF123_10180 [Chloroflexota bacterium]|nr:hypothetical protein [Chloroflexota bacterium]